MLLAESHCRTVHTRRNYESSPRNRARVGGPVLPDLRGRKFVVERGRSLSGVRLRKRFDMGARRDEYCFLAQLGTSPLPI